MERVCPMSLFFYPHVAYQWALCLISNLRNANVALSILELKAH